MADSNQAAVRSASLTFFSFAVPIAMLGVVWGDVREDLDQSLGALGLVGLVYGLGRMSAATSSRYLAPRFGLGASFVGATAGLAVACALVASAPSWSVFLVGFGAVGVMSGVLDSLGASFITTLGRIGSAGLIHGSYGLGATMGPLAVAVLPGWRLALFVAVLVAGVAAAGACHVRQHWPHTQAPQRAADVTTPLPLAIAAVSLALFATFVAIEVTTGQWAYTYLNEHRGMSEAGASVAVAGFWAGTTLGRLSMSRTKVAATLERVGVLVPAAAAFVALAVVSVAPLALVGVALAISGLCLAPAVPTLFATTGKRVGEGHAQRLAGWQLLATNLGAVAVPSFTGAIVSWSSPQAIIVVVLVTLGAVGIPLLAVLGRLGSAAQ